MNKAQAEEIVRLQEKQLNHEKRMNTQTVSQEYNYVYAKGVLEQNAMAEKILVKALEYVSDRENLTFAECSDAEDIINKVRQAISEWKKANGKI